MWGPLFSGLPSNPKLNFRMRHLAVTENHKYNSNSDDLRKTCRKEQTSNNDSEQRWGLGWPMFFWALYFVAVYCAKRSRWFRVKNKVKLSDKHGRCTSSSWYKQISPPHLGPISCRRQRVIFMMTFLTAHIISTRSQETRKVEARDGGEKIREMSSGI